MIKRLFIFVLLSCSMLGLVSAQNTLTYGTLTSDTLTAIQTSRIYTFDGQAGDTIYSTLLINSEELEPELRLFNPDGALLAESVAWSGMGIITASELPASGTYTLTAGINGDVDSDVEFTLLIDYATIEALEFGTTYSHILFNNNQLGFYTFESPENGLFSYVTDGDNLGYWVYNETQEYWIENGFWESPFVPLTQLPLAGSYTYVMRTLETEETDYDLTIHAIEPVPITSGASITGETNERGIAVFSFNSLGGKTWELQADLPENGDRYMYIYQFAEREWWDAIVIADYGSGPNGQPRIGPFTAAIDATYYVLLEYRDYNNQNFVVDYDLSLRPSSVLSLAPGTPISDTLNSQTTGSRNYVYQGTEGEVIRVTLTIDSEAGWPAMVMRSSVQNEMEWFANHVREGSFVFILPYDDTYSFTVTNDSDEDMQFTLLLEREK